MIREQVRSAMNGVLMLSSVSPASAASVWLFVASVERPPRAPGILARDRRRLRVVRHPLRPQGRQPERRRACCSCSAATSARSRTPGLRWANPFYTKRRISLRVRNFESVAPQGQRPRRQPDRDRARSWSGGSSTPPRRCSRWTTTRTTSTCRASRRCATWRPAIPTTRTTTQHISLRGHTAAIAEHLKQRDPGAARQGRRRGDRGAHQPPGLRAGDRRGDAAAPAGRRHHRRAPADRRGRGRHGGDGARRCCRTRASSRSTRSARRRWSATCWSCCAASAAPSRSSTPARIYQ